MYTALNTLMKKGLIELSDELEDVESRRKVYVITQDGLVILSQELHRLERLVENGHQVINKMEEEL